MTRGEVHCEEHGHGGATYVCRHIADGTAERFLADPPTADNPWPDAWCERCGAVQARCGGWNDESEAFAGVKLLCSGCYVVRRLLLEPEPNPDDEPPFPLLYRCGSCDRTHAGLPTWAARAPLPWIEASDAERAAGELGADMCRVAGHHFIRGNLEVPILGMRQRMSWGVWSSLSGESFDLIRAHWNDPQRARLEPRFGWLMNRLPEEPYPDTYALKCQVHQRPPGQRPLIVVEPTDHPLAIDQCRGVTAARAEALAIALLAEVGGGPA